MLGCEPVADQHDIGGQPGREPRGQVARSPGLAVDEVAAMEVQQVPPGIQHTNPLALGRAQVAGREWPTADATPSSVITGAPSTLRRIDGTNRSSSGAGFIDLRRTRRIRRALMEDTVLLEMASPA